MIYEVAGDTASELPVEQRIERICKSFIWSSASAANEDRLRYEVMSAVRDHYDRGGYFLDRDQRPISQFDEAEVHVRLHGTHANVLVIRKL